MLKIFEKEELGRIEVLVKNGKEYFKAVNIATLLGYSNPYKAIKDHCKRTERFVSPSNGGEQETIFIPESDLYRLIIKSKMPNAEKFENWIMEEVLPTIRKTGGYVVENRAIDFVNNWLPSLDDNSKNAIATVIEENRKLLLENKQMKPKALYFDDLIDRNLLTNFRDTAKEFHLKQKEFIDWLLNNGYIFRDKKNKLKPYNNKVSEGLFEIKEFVNGNYTSTQTLITPKGRETFKLLMGVR